jgi:hypothetical protein
MGPMTSGSGRGGSEVRRERYLALALLQVIVVGLHPDFLQVTGGAEVLRTFKSAEMQITH